ncbi:MAG: Rne/Rng family ribonuclease, partial [Steroidobacteraceae bacterium]
MKRMLVNATQAEELRVALVDGQRLYDLSVELPSKEQKKSNIYKGRIARIEPSLEACFVDYGAERHGFLPLKEISREYFLKQPAGGRINMREVLQEGQDIVVQVEKEERGNKGAALTTFISLAGRFLVLMPNSPRAGGVSRRIEGEERDQMKSIMDALSIPAGMGAIVRTAGLGRAVEELQWDLDNLKIQWDEIVKAVLERPSPFLVYRESDPVTRALRDYFSEDIGEVLVDEPGAHTIALEYMQRFMPAEGGRRLKMYSDDIPLFTRFQIESQIESAYAHKVQLPSGGSIVIDYTEALVSIDINSARATRGGDIETTATNTNLEAADEIARQLRIRDIGGLIVIDFIDMEETKNQRAVEDRLRDAMKMDRARIQIGRLSRFGLLEMSRQRLRPSLSDSSHEVCPRCQGIGSIRTVESMALAMLRLIGEEARKDRTAKVIAEVPVEVATYLINEKREWLRTLEDKSDVELIIVPNLNIDTPEYSIRRVRDDESEQTEFKRLSYQMPTPAKVPDPSGTREQKAPQEAPAVPTFLPTTPAPIVQAPTPVAATVAAPSGPRPGIFVRLWRWLFGDPVPEKTEPSRDQGSRNTRGRDDRDRRDGRSGRGRDRHRRDRDSRESRDSKESRESRPERETRDADSPESRGGDRSRGNRRGRDDHRRRGERDRSASGTPSTAVAATVTATATATPTATAASASTSAPVLPPRAEPTGESSALTPASVNESGAPAPAQEGEARDSRRGRRRGRRGRRGGSHGRELAVTEGENAADTSVVSESLATGSMTTESLAT